jgi:hypothetical protein
MGKRLPGAIHLLGNEWRQADKECDNNGESRHISTENAGECGFTVGRTAADEGETSRGQGRTAKCPLRTHCLPGQLRDGYDSGNELAQREPWKRGLPILKGRINDESVPENAKEMPPKKRWSNSQAALLAFATLGSQFSDSTHGSQTREVPHRGTGQRDAVPPVRTRGICVCGWARAVIRAFGPFASVGEWGCPKG